MLKVICLLGPPASGKTSLIKRVIKELGSFKTLRIKTLFYHEFKKHKTIILGKYLGETFEGTDRLSMSVQPVAERVFQMWTENEKSKDWTVLFEGDRLGTKSFLESLSSMKLKLKIYMLKVDGDELNQRHIDRQDSQGEIWLKGRMTKLSNISKAFDGSIISLENNTKSQQTSNKTLILEQITGYNNAN